MADLTSELAKGVIAPASGIVDALLGPKIENVRQWANEKELKELQKDEVLQGLLESYLERIIKRSSQISTLVFPQIKVDLLKVYEPLGLVRAGASRGGGGEEEQVELDLVAQGKCYQIVDGAGVGKSTFSKHIALETIAHSDKVPILIELSSANADLPLMEILARELDELDRQFNRMLFKRLVTQGKFFVILDGYDELSSSAQDKFRSEIKEFSEKKQRSSLLLTSRPQEKLPDVLGSVTLSLSTLTRDQAASILLKYDDFADLDVGKRLLEEFGKVPAKFLEAPLLVCLLYRTYGYTNSIAEKTSVFYCEIFDALYKGHDLTKSGFVREKSSELDIDSFRRLLRSFAFLYVAKSQDDGRSADALVALIDEAQGIGTLERIKARRFLNDLLLAVPLLVKEGSTIKFMHHTLAEFFAAEYIANSPDSSTLLGKVVDGPAKDTFKNAVEFVNEVSPDLYARVVTRPIAQQFVDQFEHSGQSPRFNTCKFMGEFFISYWSTATLASDGRSETELFGGIPDAPGKTQANQLYMSVDEVDEQSYIVTVGGDFGRPPIRAAAWEMLTESKKSVGRPGKSSRKRLFLLQELTDFLEEGRWYALDDEAIRTNSDASVLQYLFATSINAFGMSDANNADNRTLSVARCKEFLESMDTMDKARLDIDKLFS